ncbi:MAG: hypothetical protein U5L45_17650 [Saprospiraceae bacterium]|nr:hypothetical protein [Saprospiraceae bacterium]
MRQIIKIPLFKPTQDQLDNSIKLGKQYPVTPKQHKTIRKTLLESQKYCCCYCECVIDISNFHIEHFYEQDDYSSLHSVHSLDYSKNMIGSCEGDKDRKKTKEVEIEESEVETDEERNLRVSNTSCGHKKGKDYHKKVSVDYNLLLNPHDNITHLFSYREGYISANDDETLTEQEKDKVKYTIKRLALDSRKLTTRRKEVIEALQNEIINIANPKDISDYLSDILDETRIELYPYFSTLKDNFKLFIDEETSAKSENTEGAIFSKSDVFILLLPKIQSFNFSKKWKNN